MYRINLLLYTYTFNISTLYMNISFSLYNIIYIKIYLQSTYIISTHLICIKIYIEIFLIYIHNITDILC